MRNGYPLHSPNPYGSCFACALAAVSDLVVRNRIDGDGLLRQPEEKLAATDGSAAVEPECELVQIVIHTSSLSSGSAKSRASLETGSPSPGVWKWVQRRIRHRRMSQTHNLILPERHARVATGDETAGVLLSTLQNQRGAAGPWIGVIAGIGIHSEYIGSGARGPSVSTGTWRWG